MKLGN
jgi:hypothetical protein